VTRSKALFASANEFHGVTTIFCCLGSRAVVEQPENIAAKVNRRTKRKNLEKTVPEAVKYGGMIWG
jgi:hypothetical protein